MCFENKLRLAHRELGLTGMRESCYNPPYLRGIRRLGFSIRPFPYNSFFMNIAVAWLGFVIPWCIVITLINWVQIDTSIDRILLSCLVMTVTYCLYIAFHAEWCKKQYALSRWEELEVLDT